MVIVKFENQLYKPVGFTGRVYDFERNIFIKDNKFHRYYGPTYIWMDSFKCWYFNDNSYGSTHKSYNQKQFLKDLNEQWLL